MSNHKANADHLKQYQFKPGNNVGLYHSGPGTKAAQLRRLWLDLVTPEDIAEWYERHKQLIRSESARTSAQALELAYKYLWLVPQDSPEPRKNFDPRNYTDEQLRQILSILESPASVNLDIPPEPVKILVGKQLEDDVKDVVPGVDVEAPDEG